MIMTSAGQPIHGLRGRAKVACTNCHARKVRCDLHNQTGEPCTNCWKYDMVCKRRPSPRATIRQRHSARQSTRSPSSLVSSRPESQVLVSSGADNYSHLASQQAPPTASGRLHSQYLGEITSMLQDTPFLPPDHLQTTEFSKAMNQAILRISQATAQVPEIILHACADAYFQYSFHRLPVLDHTDIYIEQPPIILCQAVCMLGSNLRRSRRQASLAESEKYYFKAKTLVHMDFEQDPIKTLKAICFLATWNITGPVVLTSDCSWHWLGTGTRLLHQVGLHREAVCANQSRPGTCRRLAWYIFAQDKFVSAALGRPTSVKSNEFDVRPLTAEDFEVPNTAAFIFMETAKLACVLAQIMDLRFRWREDWESEHRVILSLLKDWIHGLPEGLRIHDASGRRVYRRDVYEVHVLYFVTVITYLHLFGDQTVYSAPSLACLVASSCITSLYQEMDLRDDINYLLAIHIWCFTVAAVPQLIWQSVETLDVQNNLCIEDLDTLVTALKQYQLTIPGAAPVLNAISRLRAPQSQSYRGTTIPRGTQMNTFVGYTNDMAVIRELFPFPHSMSPRLKLLDPSAQEMVCDLGDSADMSEDISWILGEFSDLSNGLVFPDGSNLIARGFSASTLG